MKMANVGVLIERSEAEKRWKHGLNVFELYIYEILKDAGVPFQRFESVKEALNHSLDILIVALESDDAETASSLWNYVESGGVVISYGGLQKLAGKLGCKVSQITGSGYADLPDYIENDKLRYLKSSPWVLAADHDFEADCSGELLKDQPIGAEMGPAFMRFKVGKGSIERWSVRIVETIVRLQQGAGPVIKDGIPAGDGTAAIDDDILKTDDGFSLNWEWDRNETETGQPYFGIPYGDLWRDVLISHLLKTAAHKGLVLPFIDVWPDQVQAVAMISHDSDLNMDESAEITLELLKKCGIQTTWCMMEPGFSPHYYRRIQEEGHELAFHYNALPKDNGHWSKEEFSRQLHWLRKASGVDEIVSNKNHYTRFEGWGEFFEWCESEGIASDQSFGPSKKGNVGFIFGTCRPYFPMAWWDQENRTYDVTEICFQSQDLDIGSWADSSVVRPLLKQIKRVKGVAHIIFHQYHLYTKQSAVDAMLRYVDVAREMGFEFWTGKRINDWVRLRRNVSIKGLDENGSLIFQGTVPEGLCTWIPVLSDMEERQSETETRYGLKCRKA
jgi:hypothetical protein